MWSVELKLIEDWLDAQDDAMVAHILSAIEVLQEHGPALGRPLVDSIAGSSVKNMKELRPPSPGETEVRILFAFDPARKAIMLLAGDKSAGNSNRDKWNGWYRKAIPEAERLYFKYTAQEGIGNDQPENLSRKARHH
ncbi:type II toxin-antitoxin system RelE/ParE family toxin [Parvibacter caecicola]|uniref:Diaminopimelate decarboxylase n=1 Tax=Parvibacter caecicola TaxID=747645 RepID=A0A7W5D3D3_9ACTN|nr:type II toxin-antitoxin system RelE/ParE family toxin [Parvibacter caecicola]MBB3172163.1 hypothetical protein [Parvibacter caecicola]MCR2041933.1 type II toxin-antitoxin system RelE/ParE family toxin [Parvibacter caecicola]RNL09617.1 diaminopimelate decarboxylase [Parvibacter caecicola]